MSLLGTVVGVVASTVVGVAVKKKGRGNDKDEPVVPEVPRAEPAKEQTPIVVEKIVQVETPPPKIRVAGKCRFCSAPVSGFKGDVVTCSYCDGEQVLGE